MPGGGKQRGAALAYVLGLLAVFGLLTALVIRAARFNDALVSRFRWDAQARLLAASGVDYALSRLDPPGPALDLGYATEGVDWRLENPDLSFRVRVAARGLLARAVSEGRARLPLPEGRKGARSALIGQGLDLGRLPALGLLNREGNLVLAGTAEIRGPVLLWRGGVRKATDYNVRWRGGNGHAGAVWDSLSAAWSLVRPDFRRAGDWADAQEALLRGGRGASDAADGAADADYDSGQVSDFPFGDTVVLEDTVLSGRRVRAGRFLKVGGGAVLADCKLLAPRIEIGGEAALEGVLAYASSTLQVTGGELRGGLFAASDSLRISLGTPLQGWPVFYVRGRVLNPGRPDSAYAGSMRIEKAAGGGIFLVDAGGRPQYDQQIRMHLGKGASVEGLIYCGGYAWAEGRLKGSLICQNLRFEHEGTIWLGHLMDARLEGFAGPKVVPAPLLFPGFPVLAFGEDAL